MKNWKKGISFIVIVVILAGITTAFVTVHGLTTYQGTVYDSASSPNVISGAYVVLIDSLMGILGADYTDSNGYYSFSVTLSGYSPYTLRAGYPRFDNEYKEDNNGGTNNFNLEGDGEKLAYLFYDNGATGEDVVARYDEILDEEGYTVEIFPDEDDVEEVCEDIDDYEIYSDTIFVYVCGHGEYSGGHSITTFNNQDTQNIASNTFKGWMDDWEAERKCILVDSCYSEGWAEDFDESPYLAMASADKDHGAVRGDYGNGDYEGKFSLYFFNKVDDDGTAVQAFVYAEGFCSAQGPKKEDNSTYTWFN